MSFKYTNNELASVWFLFQSGLNAGAWHIDRVESAWPQQDVSVVDMLEGPLWLIAWKAKFKALIRCKDQDLALAAGVEFAENGGHPFAVVDLYDWSSQYVKTKAGKVVTPAELTVRLVEPTDAFIYHLRTDYEPA